MPVTGWVKCQDCQGTNWTAIIGGETLLDGVASPNDGSLNLHADPTNDYLRCTDYDFAAAGLLSTHVIEGVEFECYGTTGVPHITPGNTMGVYITKDGSTPSGSEREFDCTGPGMQNDVLGASNDQWGNSLTASEILTSTFGFLIRQGTNTAGSPNGGRRVDYERARIYYSEPIVSPTPVMASKHRRIPDLGAVRNKGLGEKTT